MRFSFRYALILPLMITALACQPTDKTSLSSKAVTRGTVTHVVIMWLYDRADDTARTEVLKAGRKLEQIPGVVSVRGGRVLPSDRPVVDSSFDLAFVMTFRDEQDMHRYLADPVHVDTKKNVLDRYVKKYVAYDFVAE